MQDPSLHDAALSPAGKSGACDASAEIAELIRGGLPAPTLVLASPLKRALQTASLVFPDHENVRVREELRERRTGLPCDERSSAKSMANVFNRMRFSMVPPRDNSASLRSSQFASIDDIGKGENSLHEVPTLGEPTMSPNNGPRRTSVEPIPKTLSTMSLPISTPENSVGSRSSSPFKFQGLFVKEEKSDVRKRSEQLLRLLHAEAEWKHHESIAIVTHKGYLREFERGPLGRPDAEEFGNCEVRVFRLELGAKGHDHVAVTRIHPPEQGESSHSALNPVSEEAAQ
mgnify:FL=1